MPQSAPALRGQQQTFVSAEPKTHLPAYSYMPQVLPSFGASALGGLPQPSTLATQAGGESFGFNQNEFVQQVVQMSAIKEMEEPASVTSEVGDRVEAKQEALNESMISAGSATGARSELAAVCVAAGWEPSQNVVNNESAPVAVEVTADSANVTNEHSPADSPKNMHKVEEHVRAGCFGGLCGGASRRRPSPANRF